MPAPLRCDHDDDDNDDHDEGTHTFHSVLMKEGGSVYSHYVSMQCPSSIVVFHSSHSGIDLALVCSGLYM